jgi:potassium-transporting ATPase KdpC subunit
MWHPAASSAAQGLDPAAAGTLVQQHTSGGPTAFLGQPSVNVNALNLAVAAAAQPGGSK